LARFLRTHHPLLLALAVCNFVVFFPAAFMGRVVSPNDVFYNFEPWAQQRTVELPYIQNSLLNDPPTAYLPLMSLLKHEPRAFHWNPYIAAGIPGYGSSAAAVLSPFIALPVLALPLAWVWTAIIFLKLNASLLFAYLWLREEHLGKRGAAAGAIVVACAGVYSVRWLWQITNATALYPALLWLVRRAFNGRHNSILVMTPIAFAYALSGFPAAMAYGAYAVLAYAVFLAIRTRTLVPREAAKATAAVVLALLLASPSLVPFVQLLRRSGYLAMRETASLNNFFPSAHWRAFIDPDRVGNPAYRNWWGDPNLGMLNNYVEATVFLGVLTIPLALIGLLDRRARSRWFWLAFAALILASIFGYTNLLGRLPGFKYSALTRVALLLPLAAGYLAGAGAARIAAWLKWRRVRLVAGIAIVAALAFELSLFAGRFHPYLTPEATRVPSTPTIDFLRKEAKPFRVAPFFIYLWPNSSELFRIEDVRSHFGSEADYRRLLQRIDPSSWSGRSTVIQFNSLQFRFDDPLLGMLGVRWLIEQNAIDIVKWKIFEKTEAATRETGALKFGFNEVLERTVPVDAEPFWAIEVPITIEEARGPGVELTLLKNGAPVWSRIFTVADAQVMNKLYAPLRPYARRGETVRLRVRSLGVRGFLGRGEAAIPNEAPIFYGRVQTPIIFDRQLPDGRLFRNVGELPRFWPVQRVAKFNGDEFLNARFDFEQEAVITDDAVPAPSVGPNDARVTLASYAPDEQRVAVESGAPFFLASSEKLTPELAVTIDGKRVDPVEINLLFAGVPVPAGRHEIVFSRRIARGWWWVAGLALIVWISASVREVPARVRRGSSRRSS
jgi:hypothetical protein